MDSIRLFVRGLRPLTKEAAMRHYAAWRLVGDRASFEALVAHYGLLAVERAFRLFHRLGSEAFDLAQELMGEVVRTLARPLDSSKGVEFWVQVNLDRKVREYLTQGHPGISYRDARELRRLAAVRRELEGRLGRAPSRAELAEALELSAEELEELLVLEEARNLLSLDAPHPETGEPVEVAATEEVADELLERLKVAIERARLGMSAEEISALERFLAGEEVAQDELDALALTIKAKMLG